MKFFCLIFFLIPSYSALTPHSKTQSLSLPNNLKVLLISDPTLSSCGISLQISVGSSYEPPQIPGLAHLLEHMVHMKSKKFPSEGYFKQILSLYQGHSNAMTSDITTTYYFFIDDPQFKSFYKISDIFSRFFIDPIFEEEATNREINAVHNEYENDLTSNAWRFQELIRDLANKHSVFRHFSIGNKQKLDISKYKIYEELQKFFNKYYSSQKMHLVIMGNHPLHLLKKISNLFKEIPYNPRWTYPDHLFYLKGNKNKEQSYLKERKSTPLFYLPFPKDIKGKIVSYKPIGTLKTLSIVFPLQNNLVIMNRKDIKPLEFLIEILSFRGNRKSLYSRLRREGLILGMSIEMMEKIINLNLFIVKFNVINENEKVINRILKLFFRFMKGILKNGINFSNYKAIAWREFLENSFDKKRDFKAEILQYLKIFKENGRFNKEIENFTKNFFRFDKNLITKYVKYISNPMNSIIIKTESGGKIGENLYYQRIYRYSQKEIKFKGRGPQFYDDIMHIFFKIDEIPHYFMDILKKTKAIPFYSMSLNDKNSIMVPRKFNIYTKCPQIPLKTYKKSLSKNNFFIEQDQNSFFLTGFGERKKEKLDRIYNKTCYFNEKIIDFLNKPKLLVKFKSISIYALNDRIQGIPKIASIFEFKGVTLKNKAFFSFFAVLFEEKHEEILNKMRDFNGKLIFSPKIDRIKLRIFVYSDNFIVIMKKIIELIKNFKIERKDFEKKKSFLLEKKEKDENKVAILMRYMKRILYKNNLLDFENKKEIKAMRYKAFNIFLKNFQRNIQIKGLLVGNFDKEIISKEMKDFFKKKNKKTYNSMILKLESSNKNIFIHKIIDDDKNRFLSNFNTKDNSIKTNYRNDNDNFSIIETNSKGQHNSKVCLIFLKNNDNKNMTNNLNKTKTKEKNFIIEKNKSILIYKEMSKNKLDKNSGILNLYLKRNYSYVDLKILHALIHTLHHNAFNYLRTKKQLGYIVFASLIHNRHFVGVSILIQGSQHNPEQMDQEIEHFLLFFDDLLKKKHIIRTIFLGKKEKKRKNDGLQESLEEKAYRFWDKMQSFNDFILKFYN